MNWPEFLDLEIISPVSKHVSWALAVIGGFVLIGLAVKWAVHDEYVSTVIDFTENVITTACASRAVIMMLWKLLAMTRKAFNGGGNGTTPSILVA